MPTPWRRTERSLTRAKSVTPTPPVGGIPEAMLVGRPATGAAYVYLMSASEQTQPSGNKGLTHAASRMSQGLAESTCPLHVQKVPVRVPHLGQWTCQQTKGESPEILVQVEEITGLGRSPLLRPETFPRHRLYMCGAIAKCPEWSEMHRCLSLPH